MRIYILFRVGCYIAIRSKFKVGVLTLYLSTFAFITQKGEYSSSFIFKLKIMGLCLEV